MQQSDHTLRRRHGVLTETSWGTAAGRTRVATPEDKAMTSDDDFTLLDDPAFLAERKRVREALEYAPEANAELTGRYVKLNEEFLRRARVAWGGDE
jgi:hypothetical protein